MRAWELLIGGIAFLFPVNYSSTLKQKSIVWIGMLTIIAGFYFLSEKHVWPGYLSLLPVIGTYLVIIANRETSFLAKNKLFQWIGKISYSVYLWHWPLVVLLNYLGKNNSLMYVLACILLSLIFGHISYFLIEYKIRKPKENSDKELIKIAISAPILSVLAVGLFASSVYMNDGYAHRFGDDFSELTNNHVMPTRENGFCFYNFTRNKLVELSEDGFFCKLGDKTKKPLGLIFGDSYAAQYDPFWNQIALDNNLSINSVTTNWCFPSFKDSFPISKSHRSYKQCMANREYVKSKISEYKFIVLGVCRI